MIGKPLNIPMIKEVYPNDKRVINASANAYQKKIGSILFVAIIIRPDVISVTSRLVRFNMNSKNIHHKAIGQMIQYLYGTKDRAFKYKNETKANSFIYVSDTSFVDNTLNRKGSQGYVMTLFEGPIV